MTLALVVPCKNEYRRLDPSAFLDAIRAFPCLTFLFVDDGSTDETAETLAFLERQSPAVQALYLPRNVGKAEAVRAGVQTLLVQTATDWIGFWDADLATPLAELAAFRAALERVPDAQAVLGARWPHLGAQIDRTFFRNATGALMKVLIRQVLHAPVYDTQCGAKIFRRDLARRIFAAPFRSRWLFDVELLHRIPPRILRHAVLEQPLAVWRDVPGSKVRLTDSVRVFFDLLRIARDDSAPGARTTRGCAPASTTRPFANAHRF